MSSEDEYNSGDEEYTYDDDNEIEYGEEDDEGVTDTDVEMNQNDYAEPKTPHSKTTSSSSTSKDGSSKSKNNIADIVVEEGKFTITEYQRIIPLLRNLASDVSGLLDIDDDAAQLLLQMCKWDKERLVDSYFSNGEKLMRDAGLDMYSHDVVKTLISRPSLFSSPSGKSIVATSDETSCKESKDAMNVSSSSNEDTFVCRICCDDVDKIDAFALGCDHAFCRPCYSEYLRNQIGDGPACIRAHCPQHKCMQAITKSVFRSLLEPCMFEKYEVYVMRNFIETSKTMRYCPAAGCDKVAVGTGITTVQCSCGVPFCFRCGDEAHDPCSCPQLSEVREIIFMK